MSEEEPPPDEEAQPALSAEEAPPPAEGAEAEEESAPPAEEHEEPQPAGEAAATEPVEGDAEVPPSEEPQESPPPDEPVVESAGGVEFAPDVDDQGEDNDEGPTDTEVVELSPTDEVVEAESDQGLIDKEKVAQPPAKTRRVSISGVHEEVDEDADEIDLPDELYQGTVEKSKSILEELRESGAEVEGKREILEKKKQKVLGSIVSIRRGDPTYFDRQKVPKFQNSYKMDSEKPFNSEKVTQILQEVLEEALLDLSYDHDKVPKQAKWASSAIRAKVKELEYERYKIICYVTIGEKLCQDVFTMMRFLWDAERDRYAMYVHETMNLFAIGLCFGIYYE